ncbi:MAG: circularly permuted type 2 ATP-grasp protein [Deltaproteobacteria bacterium]|nr:circularly permuted type 2 ATP-grasp protein [Deltaproteobacteria bacterium]
MTTTQAQAHAQAQSAPALAEAAATLLSGYAPIPGTYDELLSPDGTPRPEFGRCLAMIFSQSPERFARAQALAELALLNQGVTFSVYKDSRGTEKIFPFCLIPRIVSAADWAPVERGLTQRMLALNHFLDDLYGAQRILTEGAVPAELVLGAAGYLPKLRGIRPAGGVRVHIGGIDLIRDPSGTFRILEDNLRTPSGVSYVVENRIISKRIHPEVVEAARVRPVDVYPAQLADTLRSVSPVMPEHTNAVVLTPGPYNSAYFEHTFLARNMGVDLVQGGDLFVEDDRVWLKTTRGPRRIHVVYRRLDDAFLDPEHFRPDSLLGVRGLMRAWAAGHVTIVNAPGNGVADDKAVYPFVPDMIRFYLQEEPILEQVPTYVCLRDDDRQYVLEHLGELVVKAVDEAGGYGMLMGPQSTAAEREEFARRIRAEPRRYIAQPRIELSTCPTWLPDQRRAAPRRVDLRPYVLTSRDGPWVLPGGLTRTALVEGSYVVNSSQGGGSKDTWVQSA